MNDSDSVAESAQREGRGPKALRLLPLSMGGNRGDREEGLRDFAESFLQNIDDVFFCMDLVCVTPYFVSQSFERIWGRPCESVYTDPSSWIECIHPEDRDRVIREFASVGANEQGQVEYRIVRPDGETRWIWARTFPYGNESGKIVRLVGIAQDCTGRKQAEKSLAFLASIVESSDDSIIGTDLEGVILSWNQASERLFGYTASEAIGKHITMLFVPDRQTDHLTTLEKIRNQERINRFEAVRVGKDGTAIDVSVILAPVRDAAGRLQGVCANYRNIADRKRAEREREMMEVQLRHAQKLESIGQLAAGIAHEINTPTQYIGDNTRFLQQAFSGVEPLLRSCLEVLTVAPDDANPREVLRKMQAAAQGMDLDYLLSEIPQAIVQTLEGVHRVSTLVSAMKEFSHPGTKEKTPIKLNSAIASTIAVTRNEWKYVADLETDFDAALPAVMCLPGDLNQVMVNLIVNAAHTIADANHDGKRGKITIRTRAEPPWAEIHVEDTGVGIPENVRDRIFEPFFTTKDVGRGTGQGLAIARSVVVDKHGGSIHFNTTVGRGTTFIIRLPLNGTSLPKALELLA